MHRTEARQYLMEQVHTPDAREEKDRLISYLLEDLNLEEEHDWADIALKLNAHMPIQYISGVAHFYGYKFLVNEHVLIPRPETEELVYLLERHMKDKPTGSLLDIGTGSGVIPIVAKLKNSGWDVSGWDVSEQALAVAEKNSEYHAVDVDWKKIDILNVDKESIQSKYDIIVSNPPYIPHDEARLMSLNVLDYEPHLALFVNNQDPLLFYRAIARLAQYWLKPKGNLYFECNEYNADEVKVMLEELGFHKVALVKDLQGKNRICHAEH